MIQILINLKISDDNKEIANIEKAHAVDFNGDSPFFAQHLKLHCKISKF